LPENNFTDAFRNRKLRSWGTQAGVLLITVNTFSIQSFSSSVERFFRLLRFFECYDYEDCERVEGFLGKTEVYWLSKIAQRAEGKTRKCFVIVT
jgi:hypothetical protein